MSKTQLTTPLILISICLSIHSGQCQDRLDNIIEICESGDIEKVEILIHELTKEITINNKTIKKYGQLENCLYGKKIYGQEVVGFFKDLSRYYESFKKLEYNKKLGKVYWKISKIQFDERDFTESITYGEKAIKEFLKYNNDSLGLAYYGLGFSYKQVGDVEKAIGCFEKGIYYHSITNNAKEIAKGYLYLGESYSLTNEKNKAKEVLKKAMLVYNNNRDNEGRANVFFRLGRINIQCQEYDEAINNFLKASKIKEKIFGENSMQLGMNYDNLGNSYFFKDDYLKAIYFYQKYLKIINEVNRKHKYRVLLPYKIGTCYTNLKQFEKASLYIDSSLHLLHFNKNAPHPFDGLQSPVDMIMILYFKGKNYHKAYEAYGCEEDLHAAAEWYGLSAGLVEYLNQSYEEADSRQYLLDRFYYVFEAAINVFYTLHQETRKEIYADSMLAYMERSRAILLKEAVQRAAVVNRAGIPDTLLKEERRLQKEIIALENKRFEMLEGGAKETSASLALASRLFDLKASHRQILTQIEKYHPAFYQDNYETKALAIADVRRRLLRPDEMLLHYFIGDDYLLALAVSDTACRAVKFAIPDSLQQWVTGLRDAIYNYALHPTDSLARRYDFLGYKLYQCLLVPFGKLPERLLIAPDGLLEYLPFEALLYQPVTVPDVFDEYPYLVRRHTVRYTHSLALLSHLETRPSKAHRRRVLAMAPSFVRESASVDNPEERKRNLGILRDNIKEVKEIGRIFPARIYTGPAATRERFEADAGEYSVLHLATHAKSNDDSGDFSFLAFASEATDTAVRMYVKDIYALHLHAEMVVLSACETGVGQLRRGEGLVSLARGFSYAGASSLITTLWRVGDRPSYELMQRFYRQLKKHTYKDEALRLAQLEFIESHPDIFSHPFFWAAFVPIGDMSPLQIGHKNHWRWWLVLAGLLGVLGYWTWQRRRKMAA